MNANLSKLLAAMLSCMIGWAAVAAPPQTGSKTGYRSKPAAPIDVRWLADGTDGRVEVWVTAGVDHVGARLRLIVPGAGAPLVANLPAAEAGQVQGHSWTLDRPAAGAVRLSIDLDTGDTVLSRQVFAPAGTGKRKTQRSPAPVRPDKAHPHAGADGEGGEELVRLPAEVTIRRAID